MSINNNWNSAWNYQFLSTLAATKNAYYLYHNAKESLKMKGLSSDAFHQSQYMMARKNGTERQKSSSFLMLPPQQQHLQSSSAVTKKDGGDETSDFMNVYGTNECPECSTPFSRKYTTGNPVQEGCCNHVKCRRCLISNQTGCIQCQTLGTTPPDPKKSTSSTQRQRRPGSFSFLTAASGSPLSNGYHQPRYQNDHSLRQVSPTNEAPNLPSNISTTACLVLGLGISLSNGFQGASSPPENQNRKRSRAATPEKVSKRVRNGTIQNSNQNGVFLNHHRLSDLQRNGFEQPRVSSVGTEFQLIRLGTVLSSGRRVRRPVPPLEQIHPRSRPFQQPPESPGMARPHQSADSVTWQLQSPDQSPNSMLPEIKLTYGRSPEKPLPVPVDRFAVTMTPTDFVRVSQPELPLKKRHSTCKTFMLPGLGKPATLILQPSISSAAIYPYLNELQPPSNNVDEIHEKPPMELLEKENEAEPHDRVAKKKRNPVTIYEHIKTLRGDPLLYQCEICSKKFKTKAHIKYHEFCQKGRKPFTCAKCGQGFIAKSHFEYHMRTHTGERPFRCTTCNQRGKVTRHMRSHAGEKPFICKDCGRGFANTQAMRSHMLIHTGERPYACEYCDKRFTGMTNLKKHVITHTGERPYMCSHCGKSFGLKWTLDLHLRTHSNERPFACDQCSRAFSNSKDLRRHMVIHSGERPFKCWICGSAFRRKDNLDRHIKNTHNQPKEIAKQLANDAAAEYLAQKNQTAGQQQSDESVSSVGNTITHRSTLSPSLKKSGGCEPEKVSSLTKAKQTKTSCETKKLCLKKHPKLAHSPKLSKEVKPVTKLQEIDECHPKFPSPEPESPFQPSR